MFAEKGGICPVHPRRLIGGRAMWNLRSWVNGYLYCYEVSVSWARLKAQRGRGVVSPLILRFNRLLITRRSRSQDFRRQWWLGTSASWAFGRWWKKSPWKAPPRAVRHNQCCFNGFNSKSTKRAIKLLSHRLTISRCSPTSTFSQTRHFATVKWHSLRTTSSLPVSLYGLYHNLAVGFLSPSQFHFVEIFTWLS
jgi:hypothetical protein